MKMASVADTVLNHHSLTNFESDTKELIVPGDGCPKGISGKPCVPPGVRWVGGGKKTRFRHIRFIRHLNELG